MIDEKCAYYHNGFCLKGMVGTICKLDDCVAHTPRTQPLETIEVKILHLPLKAKWFKMQESGEKPEEYREINKYWCRRLYKCYTNAPGHWGQCQSWPTLEFDCPCHNCDQSELKPYTHVCFRYGYTQRCFINRIDSITIGRGNPEWGAPTDRDVFIIKHHKEDVIVDGWKIDQTHKQKEEPR